MLVREASTLVRYTGEQSVWHSIILSCILQVTFSLQPTPGVSVTFSVLFGSSGSDFFNLTGEALWVRVATAFLLDANLSFPIPFLPSLRLVIFDGKLSLEGEALTGVMISERAGLPRRARGDLVFGVLSSLLTPARPLQVSGVPALARAAFLQGVVNLFT